MNQQLEDALLPINTSDKAAQEDMFGNESKRTPQAVAKMLSKVATNSLTSVVEYKQKQIFANGWLIQGSE
jgi:hypothetical protein